MHFNYKTQQIPYSKCAHLYVRKYICDICCNNHFSHSNIYVPPPHSGCVFFCILPYCLGKTHIKKVFFLVVGPLRFYPPYTNGLVVHATFFPFFCLIIAWCWPKKISPIFGLKKAIFFFGKYCFQNSELMKVWTKMLYFILPGEFSPFIEKSVFLLSGLGGYSSLHP